MHLEESNIQLSQTIILGQEITLEIQTLREKVVQLGSIISSSISLKKMFLNFFCVFLVAEYKNDT